MADLLPAPPEYPRRPGIHGPGIPPAHEHPLLRAAGDSAQVAPLHPDAPVDQGKVRRTVPGKVCNGLIQIAVVDRRLLEGPVPAVTAGRQHPDHVLDAQGHPGDRVILQNRNGDEKALGHELGKPDPVEPLRLRMGVLGDLFPVEIDEVIGRDLPVPEVAVVLMRLPFAASLHDHDRGARHLPAPLCHSRDHAHIRGHRRRRAGHQVRLEQDEPLLGKQRGHLEAVHQLEDRTLVILERKNNGRVHVIGTHPFDDRIR